MRIVRLKPMAYDMLQQLSEMLGMTEQEALTHIIVVAFCEEKYLQNEEDDDA